MFSRMLPAALAFCTLGTAVAQVRLPHMIGDHAVLQRDRPIHLWGWSSPNARLTARFHRQVVPTTANALGKWSVYLAPEQAGGPYALTVEGDGQPVTVSDLLVGDVWIASGQSNMEMPLAGFPPTAMVKDSEKEIAAANHPRIRLLLLERKTADFPQNDITTSWTECTPATAKSFSAIAYFFGHQISERENVPVGLIDTSWGGTPADPWVSLDTLGTDPNLLPAFASRARFAANLADVDLQIAAERREDEEAKVAGKPAPKHPWHPYQSSFAPAQLYNAMIAPLTPMEIKGFLWYQGETNSGVDRAPFYRALMTGLIGDWRMHFAQGDLPFLFVQISSFESPEEHWGMLRDQQRRTLAVANTAMAVTLDVGLADNVHPPDKQTVADRLALAARNLAYGEKVPYQGPVFHQATVEVQADRTSAMRVWFDHAEGLTSRRQPVDAFELAGEDRHFVPAQSRIEGATVLVSSAAVSHPKYVRFGWMSVVPDSLYNRDGLPLSTFTSEERYKDAP